MKLTAHEHVLPLHHPFTIARGSDETSTVVIVELEHDGITGIGEACPTSYYNETPASVLEALAELAPWLEGRSPLPYRHLLQEAAERLGARRAALCALDLAVHDWFGKHCGLPLYRLVGADPARMPETSFTIGIDTIETMVDKLKEAQGCSIIKVKLGTGDDIGIVEALRRQTSATLRVDANCAWSAEEAIAKSKELARLGVEFIEQPLPAEELEAMEKVFRDSALPVVADENSVVPADIPTLPNRFHGFNIKLVKCGGVRPALQMIELGRTLGFKLMLGCMVESSISATAAAHLAPFVDYADLDGPLLISEDPYDGVRYAGSTMTLPQRPGLGVLPQKSENGFDERDRVT